MKAEKFARLPLLDTLRGVAILGVFAFHALGASYGGVQVPWRGLWRDFGEASLSFRLLYPLTYGGAGVAVFFAVSGFCIHMSHCRSGERSFGGFMLRRFFRVYPPYLLALLIFCFVYPWGALALDGWRLKQLVTHLLLVHNLDKSTFFGINASFWSVAVEMQLYLLYPLMAVLARRTDWRRVVVCCGCIEIPIRLGSAWFGYSQMPALIVFSPFAYCLSWALGAWLADCWLTDRPLPFARWPLLPLFALTFAVGLFRPTAPFGFLLFSLSTTALIAHGLSGKLRVRAWPGRERLVKHLQMAGIVSYSFYLFHQPFVKLVPRTLSRLAPELSLHPLVVLVLCLTLWWPLLWMSHLLFVTVEQTAIAAGRDVRRLLRERPLRLRMPRARK